MGSAWIETNMENKTFQISPTELRLIINALRGRENNLQDLGLPNAANAYGNLANRIEDSETATRKAA